MRNGRVYADYQVKLGNQGGGARKIGEVATPVMDLIFAGALLCGLTLLQAKELMFGEGGNEWT